MNNLRKKVLMMTMAAATLSAIAQQPVDYVNPIIGTNGMGHTFPGACTPFGWVQLSPDTDTIPHNVNGAYQKNAYEYCAGYQYRDKTIVGFSHTHLSGTGHSDLGDILLMPAVGDVKLNPGRADYPEEGYRSRFDHATEKAVPTKLKSINSIIDWNINVHIITLLIFNVKITSVLSLILQCVDFSITFIYLCLYLILLL